MRVTINQIREMKEKGEKITMLTAYDYSTARIVDGVDIPLILVGDSLGMVVLGYESTIPVTMDEMIHHTKAVVRGSKQAMVIGDMPFMTYHLSVEQALKNAARFIQEGGAQAVKLEGGVTVADKVRRIVECGVPVMGHIGLTPQSINQLSGYKVQGRSPEAAIRMLKDAQALEEAGAFAVVLETVPAPLAALITGKVRIPTIGIGAGIGCDGQVQVINDILGSFADFVPRHAKQYARLADTIRNAVSEYYNEVKAGTFPTDKQSFSMEESILAELKKATIKPEDIVEIPIKKGHIDRKYVHIPVPEFRKGLLPNAGAIQLVTNINTFAAKIYQFHSRGEQTTIELHNDEKFAEWYDKLGITAGDKAIVKVIRPMNEYRLETVK